jgi:hypothetical protein
VRFIAVNGRILKFRGAVQHLVTAVSDAGTNPLRSEWDCRGDYERWTIGEPDTENLDYLSRSDSPVLRRTLKRVLRGS